ncbi:MAG: flagellar assembly protein FliW [bacterium]|nr:flagellar assembly protein FliW [bacterium]
MPKFKTVRFGEFEYREEDVIHLAEGLVGMPNLRNWLILEMGDDVPMKWFQSLDRGDFGFPVAQSYLFHDDYEVKVGAGVRAKLGTKDPEDLATLIITTVHAGGAKITGNLLAPLVIDTETRAGQQLTIDDASFSMRQEINYFKFGLAVKSDAGDNEVETNTEESAQAEAGADGSEASSENITQNEPEPAGV